MTRSPAGPAARILYAPLEATRTATGVRWRDDTVSPFDLLARPAPDDIEIAARHRRQARRTRPKLSCDLPQRDASSNARRDRPPKRGRRIFSGPVAWNLATERPQKRLGSDLSHAGCWPADRRARPKVCASVLVRLSRISRGSALLTEVRVRAGLRRYQAEGDAWKPESVCYYFINDSATPSFVVDVSDHYEIKRRALACHVTQFQPSQPDAVATRLTSARFRQLIESRDSQFGAVAGVAFAAGIA